MKTLLLEVRFLPHYFVTVPLPPRLLNGEQLCGPAYMYCNLFVGGFMKGEPGICFDDAYGVRIGKTTYPKLYLEVKLP